MRTSEELLSNCGLRKTTFRKKLLKLFQDSETTLTVEDIKKKIGNNNDKVTIYRALSTFEKSGLIHQVPDKNKLSRYALCNSKCKPSNQAYQHAHFICDYCDNTFCIEELEFPKIKKIKGFEFKKLELIIQGSCPNC
ncbi:MAG: hypothetical protein CMD02_06250 [Flavobacteriales bacterium]|nr:hypothetical protein [Flavobacteriales bacterium]|tara:strand:- start:7718 stop:8128 length:411 start_codon:yes stop_codon:yes gene_type:complete